jgi:hypothetical protein
MGGAERWATDSGVTKRGTRGSAGGGGGAAGRVTAAGLFTMALGGAGGGGAVTTVACSLRSRMAFIASPGLEIFLRSIFGRKSSPPAR